MSSHRITVQPWFLLTIWIILLGLFVRSTSAEECSATKLCPSGCCSKFGFCGFGDDHCGSGCLSTCDATEDAASGGGGECSASVPCKIGCCSKYGNCGFGEDYCSEDKGCLNSCGLKSECDAGWGLDWAESRKCPLNVCCSKYGFCGTTDEFCGEKDKVKRPSCSVDDNSIKRVIGYYEQWSGERPCGVMSPEGIPAGYYTHVNFAFAGINPKTFEITMSEKGDDELWTRIQSLRLEQPGVEIWIALGGWVFNDADQPTATTFSDIAGSEENQKAFAKSLLSMMSTYNFDGVDIDWEYPAADDRSGRKADFDNFPKWMKNLRSQLKSSGKKYGLSLTLPASYWYLQHFDIKKLEDSVDWFNVMSYDMHGTWDMNSTWVGPFINPHTNLTEIKNAMDLLWRNDISPSKVVMGLAYYGRSFTLVDPACAEPGCTYRSGGNSGECSETIGFLLNSEIQNIISEDALTPTFYEEDAVKAIAFGDQWVSFDDEDTFKIRGDYAKSQCMGGVMVWAISHDDRNHTSAKALTSGLGRKRIAFPDYPTSPSTSSTTSSTSARSLTKRDDTEKNIDVCRWTNCGDDCPAGWKWIPRSDSDNLSMTDDTGCFSGFSKLCCPGDVDIPTCKWRGMPKHGGYCTPGCDDDEVEVGTLGAPYCDFRHQSACCTKTPSTEPYGQCKWVGGSPTCSSAGNHHDCPDDYPDFVFASSNGAGGEQTCDTGAKSYCCKKDATPWQFKKCDWKTKETHKFSDFLCEPSCADGWTRLGMQMGSCTFSREAYCCEGDPPEIKKDDDDDSGDDGDDDDTKTSSTIIPRDPEQMYYGQYEKLIDDYMAQPGAPDDWQSSSWSSSGDDNDDEIQLWYKRSILSVASFEYLNSYTARTVDTMLNATTNLWDINGPAPIYGEALYIEAMNQVVADSGYTINTYAYVSDMTANPSTANQGMNYLNTAASDLCEVEEDYEYSSKRDFVEVNNRASLAERHINVLGEYGNAMLFQPTIEDILDGIMNNELTMHYARWEHYADNNRGNRVAQSGPFLEIAYWIGTTIGTLGPNAYRYQETSQDRWVVFHLHTVNDTRTFRNSGTANSPFEGVNHITVYHGQRLMTEGERYRNNDLRVYNQDTQLHADGSYTGNTRSSALECPRGQRWYVGAAGAQTPTGRHRYAATLQQWGARLRSTGYLAYQSYRVLYDNAAAQPQNYQRYGRGMGRNFLVAQRVVDGQRQLGITPLGDAILPSSSSS